MEHLASKTAASNGLELCGVKVLAHLIPITIQVQIRHSGGGDVSLEDCARFNEPMGQAIETSKIINDAYVLEISSPGLSDQLLTDRDFKTFRGFPVEVTYKDERKSEKRKSGLLHERSDESLHLNIKGKINRISRQNISEVRLISPTD